MPTNSLYVKDFYRRWWWAYLLCFVLFAVIAGALCFDKNRTPLPFGIGVFIGVLLLASELNFRTNARTLMTLPISLKSLCASLWFLTVPYSALFVTAAAATGVTVAKVLGASHVPGAADLVRLLFLTMSMNAFMLVVLTFLLHRQPENPTEQIIAGVSGGAWGLGISCGISVPMLLNHTPGVMEKASIYIIAAGVICGIISWKRCPVMLQNRTRRGDKNAAPANTINEVPTHALTGFRFLLWRNFKMALGFSILMQVFMLLTLRLMHASSISAIAPMLICFPLFFTSIILHLPYLSMLRGMRSLPVNGSQLAWIFITINLVTLFGALLPIASYPLVGIDLSMFWANLPLLVTGVGCFCLLNSFLMHAGAKWAFFVPIFTMPSLAFLPLLKSKTGFAWDPSADYLLIILGFTLVLAAYAWNLRSITKRSRIYQPHFHMLAKAQMGM